MKSQLTLLVVLLALTQVSANKIQFDFYYESLCPGCYQFLTQAWKTALYTPDLYTLFDLNLYPYGNASQTKDGDQWQFSCQHGPQECEGNIMEACMQDQLQDLEANKAIICLEEQEHVTKDFTTALQACAVQFTNIDVDKVITCTNNQVGNNLMHKIATQTDNLNPPHQWVPWLVVNNVYSDDVQDEVFDNPVKYICENSDNASSVAACSAYTQNSNNKISKSEFCFKNSAVEYLVRR